MESVAEKTIGESGFLVDEDKPKPKRKRLKLDLGFLSMRLPNGLPRFACVPLYWYREFRPAYAWIVPGDDGATRPITAFNLAWGDSYINFNIIPRRGKTKVFIADVPSKVPTIVEEEINQARVDGFQPVAVAWEAVWREAPLQSAPKDPIVIGKRDGVYYVISSWDMTKLESYVVEEFTS